MKFMHIYRNILSAIIFIVICKHLTSNIYRLIILLLGDIMFGLDSFGEWEDLILYKQENKAIVEKSVWTDRICSGNSGEISLMKLTDIRHVGISEIGLFIVHRNGQTITLNMRGLTREEIQNLRKEINYFLNMSRLENLDFSLIDSSDRLLLPSDSEEYLQNLPRTCLPNELTVSDNILGNSKACYRVQQNLSYPTLMCGVRLNSYQSASLKRGFYTENSKRLDCVKYRNICAVPNLTKINKEHN
ncbi:uncharacterized protein LOC112638121 isoform X2 [Camponotus floridanus]|uniref:uncharacterized protein LOC112638121 isoform X2 n=1 Tax=Camponotus floridanus TaxID=104421 RepID=UPI000DC68539|nr:uncharacterized protein LOC112638121 isoform X2 [Camponotus floridanus]